jgi:hypothetical protein
LLRQRLPSLCEDRNGDGETEANHRSARPVSRSLEAAAQPLVAGDWQGRSFLRHIASSMNLSILPIGQMPRETQTMRRRYRPQLRSLPTRAFSHRCGARRDFDHNLQFHPMPPLLRQAPTTLILSTASYLGSFRERILPNLFRTDRTRSVRTGSLGTDSNQIALMPNRFEITCLGFGLQRVQCDLDPIILDYNDHS